jgi:membrane-associated protease RseP (regulator of RpoE activity)
MLALAAVSVAAEPAKEPADTPRPTGYFIGVECFAVPPAIQAHLRLPEGQGLLVLHVLPDSPATKAGLREHDVLVKANARTLGSVQDLVAAVDAAKQTKLKLEVLRAGRTITVEVQPAPRPESLQGEDDMNVLRGWFDRVMPGENWPPRFYVFRPGAILPPGASIVPPLAEDTTVVITRRGSQPAKVVVERGSQRWELSEKELDKLPADLRPQVERMVHPYDLKPSPLGSSWPLAPETGNRTERQRQKHVEQMQREIGELQKAMQELRDKAAKPANP